jgi:hypothetical protein
MSPKESRRTVYGTIFSAGLAVLGERLGWRLFTKALVLEVVGKNMKSAISARAGHTDARRDPRHESARRDDVAMVNDALICVDRDFWKALRPSTQQLAWHHLHAGCAASSPRRRP